MGGGLIFNPGSGPVAGSGEGWQNCWEGAQSEARRYLAMLHDQGIRDVDLYEPEGHEPDEDGRWTFQFRHQLTGKTVELSTHGVASDQWKAYTDDGHTFGIPRSYWNGSSSEPHTEALDAFAAPGWRIVQTFEPDPTPVTSHACPVAGSMIPMMLSLPEPGFHFGFHGIDVPIGTFIR